MTTATATKIERANRVSVQAIEGGFEAKFHRTHKLVATVLSQNTSWQPQVAGLNKTAQRELFRVWVCENANQFGVEFDPTDRRDESNQMPAKYTSDKLLMDTAGNLVQADIVGWVAKLAEASKLDITLESVVGEEITPKLIHKGKTVNAKYGNGNWSYATVEVTATVKVAEEFGYVRMECELVSGQLKKPASIGELGYTFTGFKTELGKDIPALVAEPTKAEESKPEQPAEQPKGEESKPSLIELAETVVADQKSSKSTK